MSALEVALTLALMAICATRMIKIGHLMRPLLTKYAFTALTIIIVPLILSPLCLLLLVCLGVYIANLYAFYFYGLIGKLIDFFSFRS